MVRERFNFDFPSLDELEKTTSLIFVNAAYAFDDPEPLQPNMIQVGGLQIVDAKPLAEVSKIISILLAVSNSIIQFSLRTWKLS